jgi:hypothetical protein
VSTRLQIAVTLGGLIALALVLAVGSVVLDARAKRRRTAELVRAAHDRISEQIFRDEHGLIPSPGSAEGAHECAKALRRRSCVTS